MKNKYGAKKITIDNIVFDSKKEAMRYQELRLLERNKSIHELVIKPKYELRIAGIKICTYIADFSYKTYYEKLPDGTIIFKDVVEDVKGFKTRIYQLKKKLMKAIHGIDILET